MVNEGKLSLLELGEQVIKFEYFFVEKLLEGLLDPENTINHNWFK